MAPAIRAPTTGASRNTERVGAGQHGEAESERDARPADANREIGVGDCGGCQHSGAATAEHEPEGTEKLGPETLRHGG